MRTFTTQVETLKKYRATGQQKMTVEHINVFPGGQAAVGMFTGGMGPKSENGNQSHGKDGMLLPERTSVLGQIEANGLPMPSPGGERQESVPLPWGTGGSA